jgi:hypothetical protein
MMADSVVALQKSGSATFSASGVATVELRNGGLTRWHVKNASISTTSTAKTQLTVYRGNPSANNQLDNSKTANLDSSDSVYTLAPSEYATFRWVNGTPGAIATVRIEGDEIITGRRIY